MTSVHLLHPSLTSLNSNSCFSFCNPQLPPLPNVRTQSPSVPRQCPSRVPVSEGKYRHNQSPTIQLSSPSAPNFRGKPIRRQFAPQFQASTRGVNMAPWKIAPPLRAPIRRFRGRPSLISIRIRRRWLGWPSPTAVLLHRPSQLGLSHIVLGRLCLHSPLPQVLRAILSPLCGGIQNAEPPLRPAGSKRSGGAWCWLPIVNPFSFSKVSATSANAAQGHGQELLRRAFYQKDTQEPGAS